MNKLVFYIGSLYRGGAQRVLSVLMNNLVDKYRIILITDITPTGEREEYKLDSRVKRYYLDAICGNNSNTKKVIAIRKIVKKERPGFVISFLGQPNVRNIIATIGLRVKTIVSVRNDPYMEYGKGIRRIAANILFLFVNKCVFQTRDAKNYFKLLSSRKAVVIANPVDDKFFEMEWKGDTQQICVVGRLEKQKNPELVLESFYEIQKKYPMFTLDFYGDGSLKELIVSRSKELGIKDKVILHGEVNDTAEVYSHAFMFILCSDYEGMPNALMEAMTIGCPVISTDCPCGGPRFLISNADDGLLVPVNDKMRLSKAIAYLIEHNEKRLLLGKKARIKAENYKVENVINQWVEIVL